ncbi:hypothetical protein N2152v2_004860 [Parachlorella kessleri]
MAMAELRQQPKKNKLDRRTRRVSFAPDPELTMIHHFEKDDISGNSEGRAVLSVLTEHDPTTTGGGEYQPGFLGKSLPDHSPLHGSHRIPLDEAGSPEGMDVSMEITQPVLEAQEDGMVLEELEQDQQQGLGDTSRPGPVGAWGTAAAPGEVTAGLPSFGALVEEDAYDSGLELENRQQQLEPPGGAAWHQAAGGSDITLNVTQNITGGLRGLGSLVEEDEEAYAAEQPQSRPAEDEPTATAGMDLTVAAGRVLEHSYQPNLQAAQQQAQEPDEAEGAVQPSEVDAPTAPAGRRSSTGEQARQQAAQVNKWGFAPGGEDTLDINLELQGRMFMGDHTFNRLYGDNTTGESTLGQPASPLSAAGHAPEPDSPLAQAAQQPAAAGQQLTTMPAGRPEDSVQAPELSPQGLGSPAASAGQQAQPNWQAPAFLPPYAQKPKLALSSDHPALVQSPTNTNSTMNTLETQRLMADGNTRRLSISSRRAPLQDATGHLLQDDFGDDDLGLDLRPATQPLSCPRESLGAGASGPDATVRLLVDEEPEGNPVDHSGPLAGIKRQLGMLSQGSQDEMAVQQQPQQATEVELKPLVVQAARTPTPPRPAHSFGMADSSNPVTMALLRSGGTTRLLQDTVHVKPGQQAQKQPAAVGVAAAAAGPTRTSAGGRSNGTTKLLADMTMASMVGAKLRGQHTGPLNQRRLSQDDENGLTDYSLDAFEAPPELPVARQQLEQQPGHERANQPEPPNLRGYSMVSPDEKAFVIPGGPKIHRTPVPMKPSTSQQRHQTTPHSTRSMHSHSQQVGSASRQQQVTPISVARPSAAAHAIGAAAYPVQEDETTGIPGGPKLMRTPVGGRPSHVQHQHEPLAGGAKTPVTGRLPAAGMPGSAMAQHYPGSAARPTSVGLARYPGSAMATHRLGSRGMTPLQQYPSQPLPMTFQDFTKLMDVQFLDNLRRGASINYADMQRNPVPKTLQEAYSLLCCLSPQVSVLENGIRILQELVQERRVKAADQETFVGLHNPALFGEVQYVDEERLEAIKVNVGLLKKLLRQKAVAELKLYRKEMEEDRAHRLMRNLDLLQQDRVFLEQNEQAAVELAKSTQAMVAEQLRRMDYEAQAQQAEAERRERVQAMRAALQDQQESNAQRQQQLEELQNRVRGLKLRSSTLGREREAVQSKIQSLQQQLSETQDAAVVASQSSPQALLEKSEQLEILTACVGWRLEQLRRGDGNAELVLRLADRFRLQLCISNGTATGKVSLAAGSASPLPADRQQLAADLLCSSGLGQFSVDLTRSGREKLAAAVQAITTRVGRIAELLQELHGLRLKCTTLTEISCAQGAVHLAFVDLQTEVQFSLALKLPSTYPLGDISHELKIRSSGGGHVTEEAVAAAVAAVPQGRGRVKAVCAVLSQLAKSASPAQPYFLQPAVLDPPAAAAGALVDANFQNY